MTEKPGVATRLMYQLFVALNRKKVRGGGIVMCIHCVCVRERVCVCVSVCVCACEREREMTFTNVSVCISVVFPSKGS